ncbi:MAG: aspartate carbamoyltransferase regulatory subunit [Sulfolobales archaeon]
MSNATLTVSKIKSGTVIDHIPSGKAIEVLRLLGVTGREGYRVAILMNVESQKLGRKDIIKMEGKFLDAKELNLIALVAPTATINIIEDFEVKKKFRVVVPDVVEEVLKCPNPTCITNKEREPIKPIHKKVREHPLEFQCLYCGTIVKIE